MSGSPDENPSRNTTAIRRERKTVNQPMRVPQVFTAASRSSKPARSLLLAVSQHDAARVTAPLHRDCAAPSRPSSAGALWQHVLAMIPTIRRSAPTQSAGLLEAPRQSGFPSTPVLTAYPGARLR